MLLKWGQLQALAADYGAGGTVFAFPVAATIPAFGQVFTMYITDVGMLGDSNTAATLNVFNNLNFTVIGSQRTALVGANATFNYLAVGIQ